jgi:hypothetical protein
LSDLFLELKPKSKSVVVENTKIKEPLPMWGET